MLVAPPLPLRRADESLDAFVVPVVLATVVENAVIDGVVPAEFGGEQTMLVAAHPDADESRRSPLSRLRVLQVVGRRVLPSLIEATIIPAVLFYTFFTFLSPVAAMLAVLTRSYGAVVRRLVGGHGIPGILQLAALGLTVRTVIGIASGTFLYFLQPIAATLALALLFLGSRMIGKPIIARMACDFCPIEDGITARPAVTRLFSGLTLLWAGVHLLTVGTTFAMLMSMPTGVFLPVKTFVSLGITISAVVWTITWAMRTAKAENLVFARVDV